MPEQSDDRSMIDTQLSRRAMLRLTGLGIGGAVLLAACGKSSTTTSPTGGGSNAAPSKTTTDFIRQTFGGSAKAMGAGLTLNVGAGLLLSTSQAVYGQQSLQGIHLAAKQIKAAGGPTFTFNVRDLSTPAATAAADAVTSWGQSHIAMGLGAGFFGTGNMIPGMEQYKILVIDPGGGTSTVFQDKPYAWAGRAITPNDAFPGVLKWLALKLPKAKRFGVTGYDLGPLTTSALAQLKQQALQMGPKGSIVVGQSLVPEPGTGTDNFAAAADNLRNMNPDVIWNWSWGSDTAAFMKAYAPTGLTAPVIGPDYQPGSDSLAGSAYDGYMFAFDYFNSSLPENPWAKLFVDDLKSTYNEASTMYQANYYEQTFILWELVKRVIAAGGNVNSGADLQAALESNPTFASVYGKGSETGSLTFSTTTHSLAKRPMGLYKLGSGFKVEPLASFDIGGADFKLA